MENKGKSIEDLVISAGVEIDEEDGELTLSLSFDEEQTKEDTESIKKFIKDILDMD